MSSCQFCGAPITLVQDGETVCGFCGRPNAPAPKEVAVPIPVEIVNKFVNVIGGAGTSDEARELRCPNCRKRLVAVQVRDVELNGCSGCGGIWVDNASSRRILANPEAVFGELAERAAINAKSLGARAPRPICAECPAVLDGVSVHGIVLDVCSDHGTWFDAFELERLTRVLRGEEVPGVKVQPDAMIRCASCSVSMRASDANLGDLGPMCDTCWRKRQETLRAAGEASLNARSAGVGASVMVGLAAALIGAMGTSKT